MTPLQKMAWFNVIVFAVALVCYSVLAVLLGPYPACSAFALCAAWGFGDRFLRRRRGGDTVVLDERDLLIQRTAIRMGFGAFWGCFVLACMIPWAILTRLGSQAATIRAEILPLFVVGGMLVVWMARSIAILVLYGRSRANEHD